MKSKTREKLAFEVVDGGEMSKENFEVVVRILAEWVKRELEDPARDKDNSPSS